MSLGFEGKIVDDLKRIRDIWTMPIAMDIQDAWLDAPNSLALRIQSIANSGSKEIRGPLWELYLWKSLSKFCKNVEYEPISHDQKSVLDFQCTTKSGYQFIVEATVYGPNESGLLAEIHENDPNRFETIRQIFKKKIGQIQTSKETPVVLAFCNSFISDFQSKFQKVQILYGQPAVQYNKVTLEEKMIFTDEGFWYPNSEGMRSFDAIYFGSGYLPGFSENAVSSTWLNPISDHPLDIREFQLESDFYKSDEYLYVTNSKNDFKWLKTDIF